MAGLMNQRRINWRQRGGVALWALAVSVGLHLAILIVFGLIKFSRLNTAAELKSALRCQVSQIEKFIKSPPIIPKPKIKKPSTNQLAKKGRKLPAFNFIAQEKKTNTENPTEPGLSPARILSGENSSLLPSSKMVPAGIEFFGSFTNERKACYVVDCSGSMLPAFGQVREKLKSSIRKLQQDQYFYIIFFGGDRLFEYGRGRLARATEKNKSTAYDFIDAVRPGGKTNALNGLRRAMKIHDSYQRAPAAIYLLTDGFELAGEDSKKFVRQVLALRKEFAPTTKMNTIGFLTSWQDCKILEEIAKQTGGECIFIEH